MGRQACLERCQSGISIVKSHPVPTLRAATPYPDTPRPTAGNSSPTPVLVHSPDRPTVVPQQVLPVSNCRISLPSNQTQPHRPFPLPSRRVRRSDRRAPTALPSLRKTGRVERWRGGLGSAYLFPALVVIESRQSSAGEVAEELIEDTRVDLLARGDPVGGPTSSSATTWLPSILGHLSGESSQGRAS